MRIVTFANMNHDTGSDEAEEGQKKSAEFAQRDDR